MSAFDELKKRPFKNDVEELVTRSTQNPKARSHLLFRLRKAAENIHNGTPADIEKNIHRALDIFNEEEEKRDRILELACNIYQKGKDYVGKYFITLAGAAALATAAGALTIAVGIGSAAYVFKVRPHAKNLETKIARIQTEAETARNQLEDIKTAGDKVFAARTYSVYAIKNEDGLENYVVEVEPTLPNGKKTSFSVDKNALYGDKGLLETIRKAEAHDRSKGAEGVLGDRTSYTPAQCVQLLQAVSRDSGGTITITLAGCEKAQTGGLNEIVGGSK